MQQIRSVKTFNLQCCQAHLLCCNLVWQHDLAVLADTGASLKTGSKHKQCIKIILYRLWLFLAVYLNHAGFVSYG